MSNRVILPRKSMRNLNPLNRLLMAIKKNIDDLESKNYLLFIFLNLKEIRLSQTNY